MKNHMSKNPTVSVLVGRVNEDGQYFEELHNDVKVVSLPDDVIMALNTEYDVAIRLDNHVSITVFAKDTQVFDRYLEHKGVPHYFQCFFEELSEYPPDVMWYYSNVSVTDKF